MSTMLFAKEENPNVRKDLNSPQKETFLVAKKTIEKTDQLQKPITLSTTAEEKELTTEEKCIIEIALGPVIAGPPYHCTQI